jgi:hypothetical protein
MNLSQRVPSVPADSAPWLNVLAYRRGSLSDTFFEINEYFQETVAMFLRALIVPIALVFVAACFSTGAMAQSGGDVFVATSNGDDAANCAATTPFRTLAHAASIIGANGRITCLDGGDFRPFTITQSVTINCDTGHVPLAAELPGLTASASPFR